MTGVDSILLLNKRGHTVEETHAAAALLRAAGFKIVLHWMPNLLGATLAADRADFARLWEDICPDEIKIYPTQLLANAELYEYWLRGEYTPYTTQELIHLIADIKPLIPRYCRVNRVIRDIPSTNVVEGNKRTSLRLDVKEEMARRGTRCQCVRCREVRKLSVAASELRLEKLAYPAGGAEEHFISFVTPDDHLAGFLRLSLPGEASPHPGMTDLGGAAIIRDVHVYGQSLEVGATNHGAAQHAGLGSRLIRRAEMIASERGYHHLAVSARWARGSITFSPPARNFLNSSFANLPSFVAEERSPRLLIHPDDAAPRRIVHGTMVKVHNDRGAFVANAEVTDRARSGVVVAPSIWWRKLAPGGENANAVTSQALTDLGRAATFYDCLVEVPRSLPRRELELAHQPDHDAENLERAFRADDRIFLLRSDTGIVGGGPLTPRKAGALARELLPSTLPLDELAAAELLATLQRSIAPHFIGIATASADRRRPLLKDRDPAWQVITPAAPAVAAGSNHALLDVEG